MPCHLLLVTRKGTLQTVGTLMALSLVFAAHISFASSPNPPQDQAAAYAALHADFDSGNFALALQQLQSHPEDNAVYYYNLGTTLLKLKRVGQATAYLEKANRIQPHDLAIQQNLQLARGALSQAIGPDRLDPASTWLETLADHLRLDEIRGAFGLVGFVIALFWIRCYLKTRKLSETLLKPAGLLGIGALAITACLYSLERVSGANPVAICLEQISIRSGPGNTYVEVAEAPAGEKLRALGPTVSSGTTPELWRQVRYSSDGIGWVPASDVLIL